LYLLSFFLIDFEVFLEDTCHAGDLALYVCAFLSQPFADFLEHVEEDQKQVGRVFR
jgi:hypothetical protein